MCHRMERKSVKKVVTCFLEKKGKILLFRRSPKVGTFKGKWAGISGYMEPDETPFQTAIKELAEETKLEQTDISVLNEGEMLSISDNKNGVVWQVYPFLFHVKTPGKIEMDWEHVESKWIEPHEIIEYDTVPQLTETLAKVYALKI